MKVNIFIPMVVLMAVLASGQARAEGCDRPGSSGEMTECAALRLKAADRELGEVYGGLMDSEDKEFTATLKQAQEAWMRWREAEGALAAKAATEADLVEYARMQQQALMTEDRIKDLRGMAGN
jgi:uncharacterized protein YecT (DUF1311 family)